MTWIAATSTYNSCVLVTDTRITWLTPSGGRLKATPEYRFGVCKAGAVARNIIAGFSGSIDIGLDVLDKLPEAVPAEMAEWDMDLESTYGKFYENLKHNYHSFYPDNHRRLGLSMLMIGLQPKRQYKIRAPGYSDGYKKDVVFSAAHTLGCKIVAPRRADGNWEFETFGTMVEDRWMPPGDSRPIGSAAGLQQYKEALAGILSPLSVFQALGDDLGLTATVLADLLTTKIAKDVDPTVSKHLFVFTLDPRTIPVRRSTDDMFPDPAPKMAFTLKEYRALCMQHGVASGATGIS